MDAPRGACLPLAVAEDALRAHQPIVQRVARQFARRLPANIDIDDMTQAGMIGLADALTRFDAARGLQFETFALPRIRGAMLDELRSADHLSRDDRSSLRAVDNATRRIEHRRGRRSTDAEVAHEMGMLLPEYHALIERVRDVQIVGLEDAADVAADDSAGPLAQLLHRRRCTALAAAIDALPERERYVLEQTYDHDMPIAQIGAALGVHESRVSQIHKQAVALLRIRLRAH